MNNFSGLLLFLALFSEKSREDMSEEGDLKKRVTPDSQEISKINYTLRY